MISAAVMPKARGSLSEGEGAGALPPPPVSMSQLTCPSAPRTSVMSGAIRVISSICTSPETTADHGTRTDSASAAISGPSVAHSALPTRSPSARTPRCGKKVGLTPPDNVTSRRQRGAQPSAAIAAIRSDRPGVDLNSAKTGRPHAQQGRPRPDRRNTHAHTARPARFRESLKRPQKPGGLWVATPFRPTATVAGKRQRARHAPFRGRRGNRAICGSQNEPEPTSRGRPDLARAQHSRQTARPETAAGSGWSTRDCPKAAGRQAGAHPDGGLRAQPTASRQTMAGPGKR